jgi:predicted kinase
MDTGQGGKETKGDKAMKVYIMRGLPGSGKDRWIANNILGYTKSFLVCSADHYHIIDNVYQWKPENAKAAHDQCFKKFKEMLERDKNEQSDFLIVNNTNCALWEVSPYVRLCEITDSEYVIIWIHEDRVTCFKRCIHKVPYHTILKMDHLLYVTDLLPPHYKVTHIIGGEVAK